MKTYKTNPGQAYVVTASVVPCVVNAVMPDNKRVQLAKVDEVGQGSFVAISDKVEVSQDSLIITPVFKGASLGIVSEGGAKEKKVYQEIVASDPWRKIILNPPSGYRVAAGVITIMHLDTLCGIMCSSIGEITYTSDKPDGELPPPMSDSALDYTTRVCRLSLFTVEGVRVSGFFFGGLMDERIIIQYSIEKIPATSQNFVLSTKEPVSAYV